MGNGDIDDATMVRIYARENATQRGNVGTAQIGSVASAVRLIAKSAFGSNLGTIIPRSPRAIETIAGQIAGDIGVGWDVIVEFLAGVPGINDGSVQQSLANLKSSGDYARIIKEVQEEIERENAEAIKAQEKAEREQKEAEREQERIRKEREEAEERQRQAKAGQGGHHARPGQPTG